ncbi:MAG TPA: LuxR family transcriptional regulator [Rhizobiaceae bacterium]|nr:LuxR family transcriptional regulator [Rhizobiaceae bacterium]
MPNVAEKIVLPQIVESVYDCIADQTRWRDTLQTLCRVADGQFGLLAVIDTACRNARFMVSYGDEAVLAPLMADYATEVPFYAAVPQMELDVPITVDRIYEMQGPGMRPTWLESRIAKEWVVPNQLDDFFWVALMKRPTRVGTMMIITDKQRPQITPSDIETVGLLAPHVRRAVTISDMFEQERQQAQIFRSIVEALAHPVLIVSSEMNVLFANSAGEALLAEQAAVFSSRGQLHFAYPPAAAAVTRAVELGMRDEFALGPAGIGVPLALATAPAVAHVMPLARRDASARFSHGAAAAIFIAAAGAAPTPALEAIAALFGLTAAEKRVASHVAAGLGRREIAASSGVSDGTVKSQLAAIFDKTGTSDQRALELLIRELSPPVASDGSDLKH